MNIFIAGATGVLGRPTVQALLAAGHAVRGNARGVEKSELLRSLGAEPVEVDLFDTASIRPAIESCEVVINLATKIPPLTRMRWARSWRENDRLRRRASRCIADAAYNAGAALYLQESITFMYAHGGDEWLTEESPLHISWIALNSMLEAEKITREYALQPDFTGRGVSLRFGAFYAPYAASTVDTARLARRRMFPIAGAGGNYFSSVHVDDAAAAIVAALDLPSGEYNVVDDEPLTQAEYATAVTQALGAPTPRHVPEWLFRFLGGGPAGYLLRSQRVSNKAFRQATGWSPQYRSAREGWQQVASEIAPPAPPRPATRDPLTGRWNSANR
jgi:nucleoside-diphosphate-sugar epimerase